MRPSRLYRLTAIILALGLLVLAGSHATHAASTGLSIQPIKISQTLEPGESVSDFISLSNASDEPIRVEANIQDFVPTAGTGNINFVGRAEGVTTVRDWITINVPAGFNMAQGESRQVAYTIRAPAGAEPGGHFGVILFKALRLEEAGQLKVGTQVGILVFVTVPGNALQKGKILNFSAPFFVQKGPVTFTMKFENTGTVHFEPKGNIAVTNIFGKKVGEAAIAGQVVLPTGAKDLTAQWNTTGPLFGIYKAQASITDGEGNELTSEADTFFAFPLTLVIIFILMVAAVFFGLRFARRRLKFSISFKK